MQDLALQVREVDLVGVRDGQPANAGGCKVERRRAAQPAGADDQRARAPQPLLPLDADLREQDVPAVAEELLVVQFEELGFVAATVGGCLTGSPLRWAMACTSWKSSLEPSSVGFCSPGTTPGGVGLTRGAAFACSSFD